MPRKILILTLTLLLLITSLKAQDVFSNEPLGALKNDSDKVYGEKVFLHTDKSFYLTGEELYFKAYVVNAVNHQPSDLSKVIYAELLSEDSIVHVQAKVSQLDGSSGALFLPIHLPTGNYTVRAYTRWMRNFEATFYFHKTIRVFNSFQAAPNSKPLSKRYDIQFFPEGGYLVQSLESKVAFRVVNEYGEGVAFRGVMLDEEEDTVLTFEPLKFGMGHFYFKPEFGKQYIAHFYDKEGKYMTEQSLPAVKEKGYVMKVTDVGNEELNIVVETNANDLDQTVVSIIAHCRGNLTYNKTQRLASRTTHFSIPKALLGEGINHITLFDQAGNPIAERLFFQPPKNNRNILIQPDQDVYAHRSNIQLNLQVPDSLDVNMSMSVYHVDDLQEREQINIENYLLLTSDLKGNIESPWYYFSEDSLAKAATDHLMLTHGWRRFDWKKMMHEPREAFVFFPEYVAPFIEGEVFDKATNQPASYVPVYFSIPGRDFFFSIANSNEKGKVYVEMHKVYQDAELIAKLRPEDQNLYQIRLKEGYAQSFYPIKSAPFQLTLSHQAQLTDRSVYMQSQRIFQQNSSATISSDSLHFYGRPDEQYELDDYTRFPIMEEVMQEYIRGVSVRRSQGKYVFQIFNLNTDKPFAEEPLILVDGVPIFHAGEILELDPFLIKRIEVKRRKEFVASTPFYGMISYLSYDGNLGREIVKNDGIRFDYQSLTKQRTYFTPKYETVSAFQSRTPDFRNLLYWNPNISSSQKLNFYSSDLSGKYEILVNGIAEDGSPFWGRSSFEVGKGR